MDINQATISNLCVTLYFFPPNIKQIKEIAVGFRLLGILGAFFALALDSYVPVDSITAWIIPFTCGGFLNIAMVTVLPDLLKSKDRSDCFKTLFGIVLGLMAMTTLSKL